ncbi:MAG: hypothetical protein JWL87_439 [Candidatus Adlerbacteria bacterium]|nr:hypothetical protein [Candidatus Adlerbacteria bacterium]
MSKALAFFKEFWFQIAVLILLIMCYVRLGEIKDNTFYTADMVDSSTTRIINSFEDYLNEIQNNTQNTWQILDSR